MKVWFVVFQLFTAEGIIVFGSEETYTNLEVCQEDANAWTIKLLQEGAPLVGPIVCTEHPGKDA